MCDGENFPNNVTERENKLFLLSTNCSKNICNYEPKPKLLVQQNDLKIKNKGFVVRNDDKNINKICATSDVDISSCSNGIDSSAKISKTEDLPTRDFAVNGYDDCIALKIINHQGDNEVKLKHISFDFPNPNEKEYTLKPCPSLDSSLSLQSCSFKRNHGGLVQTFSSSSANTTFLETQFRQLVPQSSLPVATPLTPASGIISQASLDSGVLSAHSFDFSQNFSLEVLDKRKRTASSVSSGIGEMWQSSLDGDSAKDAAFTENPVAHRILGATPSLYNINGITSEKVTSVNGGSGHEGFEGYQSANLTSSDSASGFDLHSVGEAWIGHHSFSESSDVTSSVIFPVASCGSSSFVESKNNGEGISSSNSHCSNAEEEAAESCSIFVKNLKCKSSHYANLDTRKIIEKYALNLVMLVLNEAFAQSVSLGWSIKCSGQCNQELCREDFKKKNSSRERKEKENEKPVFSTLGISSCSSSLCWTPELPFSPSHRGYSRTSKRSSLSFSHDSLVGCPPCQDDSHLIKGAISHDVLTFTSKKSEEIKRDICIDDDVYALPVDMVKNFDGPALQPKVIVQQPTKKTVNRGIRLRNSEGDMRVSSKRIRNSVAKEKSSKHRHKNKHSSNTSGENSKRNGFCQTSDYLERNLSSKAKIGDKDSEKYSTESQKQGEKPRLRNHRKESRCLDQGKLCKIIPFTSGRNTTKRKEISYDLKIDKKKNRSISSNIRNTLFTLFGLKKTQKEPGNFVNAKNEFIEASSQELSDSSDGMKWGKICPLPSAPPLVTSVKYSAFTEKIGNVKTSSVSGSTIKNEGMKKITNSTNAPEESNSCQRQSNSISPSSLLSCLGHPRTNSVDEHDDHRVKPRKTSELQRGTGLATSFTVTKRALPPLPPSTKSSSPDGEGRASEWKPHTHKLDEGCDFASIIGKVKNYGWYWGPISGEAAEKVLANEPDGSFIVRDSSDYHYIFSLTFRLNGVTRHVRIEHDQGNFSFGGVTRFKSQTIVDFIEKAVEHSRSGRYLFFLHRRPVLGPMRVQLLHPVSRFKHVQSLQHLCRFVIVKQVRKDLIHDLPLPQRLKDYLSSPHYYSEQVEQCMSSSALSLEGAVAASEDCGQVPSPCLHHSSHRKFNNNDKNNTSSSSDSNNNDNNTNETSIVPQNSSVRFCPNRISLQEPLNTNQFRRTRCSSTQAGSSSAILRNHRNKEYRLSSSHSSLENSFLQMYPASPSTISSSSASGRQNGNFYSSKLSLKRKGTPSFWSPSHSSPSSPVPFDYSPDWLSSSDDFALNLTSKCPFMNQKQTDENTTTNSNTAVSAGPVTFTQSNDILLQKKNSLDKIRLKKSPTERDCGPSASSSASQSVSDAFVLLLDNSCREDNEASPETLAPPSPYSNSDTEKKQLLSATHMN